MPSSQPLPSSLKRNHSSSGGGSGGSPLDQLSPSDHLSTAQQIKKLCAEELIKSHLQQQQLQHSKALAPILGKGGRRQGTDRARETETGAIHCLSLYPSSVWSCKFGIDTNVSLCSVAFFRWPTGRCRDPGQYGDQRCSVPGHSVRPAKAVSCEPDHGATWLRTLISAAWASRKLTRNSGMSPVLHVLVAEQPGTSTRDWSSREVRMMS